MKKEVTNHFLKEKGMRTKNYDYYLVNRTNVEGFLLCSAFKLDRLARISETKDVVYEVLHKIDWKEVMKNGKRN